VRARGSQDPSRRNPVSLGLSAVSRRGSCSRELCVLAFCADAFNESAFLCATGFGGTVSVHGAVVAVFQTRVVWQVDGSQVISVAGRQAALAAAVVFRRHFDAAAADSAIRVRIARDGRARRKKHGSKSEDNDILVHGSMIDAHSNPVCLLAHVRFGSMDCQSCNGRRHPIHRHLHHQVHHFHALFHHCCRRQPLDLAALYGAFMPLAKVAPNS